MDEKITPSPLHYALVLGQQMGLPEEQMQKIISQVQKRHSGMPANASQNYDPTNRLSQFIADQQESSARLQRLNSGQAVFLDPDSGHFNRRGLIKHY